MILPNLDPWQKEFKETKGDKILCCGRQVGKTFICSIDAAEWAVDPKNKGKNILMIAPTERQAFNLFDKTLQYLLDNHLKKVVIKGKHRPTKTKIELRNGNKIYCLPTGASGMGIRGLTIGRLYVDEASRIPEEVWAAVTPMLLTTGGNIIMLSTPFGAIGEFHRVWINKDNAYESFKRFSIDSEKVMENREICDTWTENIRKKALQQLDRAKRRMSNREYAQEYMGEFIEDLFRYFSDDLIKKTTTLKRRETIIKERKYFLGCDIARMGEDEGTFEIFDKIDNNTIEQVESIVTKKKLTTETEDRIIALDRTYNFKEIGIDAGSGSLGVGIFDHLIRIDQVKRKIIAINNRARSLDTSDKTKTKLLKEDLYDNCRSMMERGIVAFLDDDEIIESFRSVQYEYIKKEGQPTKLRIFGDYTHIVEGIIRALILAKAKNLNMWIDTIKI